MKILKILLIVLLAVLVVAPFSLAMNWDNVKFYDEKNNTITIRNALGLGSKLAEYTLEKNSHYCFKDCYAEGKLRLYSEQKILSDFYYTDGTRILENNSEFYLYLFVPVNKTRIVENYEKRCTKGEVIENGSIVNQQCDMVKTTFNESYIDYEKSLYNFSKVPAGEYNWRIEGKKESSSSVDWIIEAMGVTFDEWAWWQNWEFRIPIMANMSSGSEQLAFYVNGSYLDPQDGGHVFGVTPFINFTLNSSDQLVGYIYYNDSSAYTFVDPTNDHEVNFYTERYASATNNISKNPASVFSGAEAYWPFTEGSGANAQPLVGGAELTINGDPQTTNGVYGKGIEFDGTGDFYEGTYSCPSSDNSFTYSTWIKAGSSNNGQRVYSCSNGGNTDEGFSLIVSSGEMSCFYRDSGGTAKQAKYSEWNADTSNWQNVACRFDTDTDNLTIWVNGTVRGSVDVGTGSTLGNIFKVGEIAVGGATSFTGSMENLEMWSEAKSDDWIKRTADYSRSTLGDRELQEEVIVTVTYPENTTYVTNQTILNYTYEENSVVADKCWYRLNGGDNSTPVTAGQNFTALGSLVGANEWTVFCNATTGQVGEDSVSFSFEVAPPTVNITFPLNGSSHGTVLDTLNYTIEEATFSRSYCWYNTNLGLGNSTPVTAGQNFSIGSKEGENRWTVFCNDSVNNLGEDTTTFSIDYSYNITQNQTKQNLGEGDSNKYELYIEKPSIENDYSNTNATLYVNNTAYSPQVFSGSDFFRFSKSVTFDFGLGTAIGNNLTWYWNYSLVNSTHVLETNTTAHDNTTVFSLEVDDCSTFNYTLFNYSLFDEETLLENIDNGTIETTVEVTSIFDSSQSSNVSLTGTSGLEICVSSGVLNYTNYSLDSTTRYYGDDHVTEFHYLEELILYNDTERQDINLYDLLSIDSTSFLITYKDENFIPKPDVVIDLYRYYVGEGIWRSVEHGKTDEAGQTVLHLVEEEVQYKVFVRDGQTIDYESPVFLALCQTTPCVINFQKTSDVSPVGNYTTIDNLQLTVSLDRDTREVDIQYFTLDGNPTTIGLNVTQYDNLGNNTVCSLRQTASGGTLNCNVPVGALNTTYIVEVYDGANRVFLSTFDLKQTTEELFGVGMFFMILIFILTLGIGTVAESPLIAIFLTLLGFVSLSAMTFFSGGSLLGVGATSLYFISAGILLMWKISTRRGA